MLVSNDAAMAGSKRWTTLRRLLPGVLLTLSASIGVTDLSSASPVGTNLREVTDWSTQRPFLNLFHQSRPWLTQCEWNEGCANGWDTNEAHLLDLDEHGWVRSLPHPSEPGYSIAGTILDVPDTFEAGNYVMLYDGEGDLNYRLGAQELSSTPGRDLIYLDVANGPIHIQILATDPDGNGDYLRNLRLVSEESEQLILNGEIFNPDFLARTAPFTALRFMEWGKINGSPVGKWDERSLPEDRNYTGDAGVPVEVMVDLANRLDVAAWVNVPHRADDDYVENFAQLVRDRLDAGLHVYVEYSNEVWNSSFSQHAWVTEQARSLWPGGTSSDFTKLINWYGKRSAEVCDIWKTTFGNNSDRVTCVIATQAANDWTGSQALLCPLWQEGAPCVDHDIGAIAIAPYFGSYVGHPGNEAQLVQWAGQGNRGLKSFFKELSQGGQLPEGPTSGALEQAQAWAGNYAALARDHALDLLAYEGGQHLVGIWGLENNDQVTELFVSANRHRDMGKLYASYLTEWSNAGGGLMMHFSDISEPGKWGSWGALEHVEQTSSPKYDALLSH